METVQDGNGASALMHSSPSNPPSFTAINSPTSGPALTSQPTHTTSSRPPISGRSHNLPAAESLWRDEAEHLEHDRTPSPPAARKHRSTRSKVTTAGINNTSVRRTSGNSANALAQRPASERLKLTKTSSKQALALSNRGLPLLPGVTSSAAHADNLANAVVYHRSSGPPSAYQSSSAETNLTLTSAHSDNLDAQLAPSSSSWNSINIKGSWNSPDRTSFITEHGSSSAQQFPKRQKLGLALDDTLVPTECGDNHASPSQLRHSNTKTRELGCSSSDRACSFGNSKDSITSCDFTYTYNTVSQTVINSCTTNSPSIDCHNRLTGSDRVHEEGISDQFDHDLFDDGIEDDELLTMTYHLDFSGTSTSSQCQPSPDTGLECQPTTMRASCGAYTRDKNSDISMGVERGHRAQFVSPAFQHELPAVQWIDMKPIVRLPFPAQVQERSPIIGLSSACLLRSCFRIGEAINAGKSAARNGKNVILELYARVVSSTRDDIKQHFVFGDLFHSKPPYLKGEYDATRLQFPDLHEFDDPVLVGQEHRVYRCITKMKQSGKEWTLAILNMSPAKQEDVLWVEGIVNVL